MTLSSTPVPLLALEGITKRFGPLVANDRVSLTLGRGEILALLGENGAGKTTLMNILFGHYVADEGTIQVADQAGVLHLLPSGQPRAALAAGIGMVHQHFALAESLTVIENVVLGTRPVWRPTLRLGAAREALGRLMAESGLTVSPEARVAELSVGEKQRVELLKVLYRGARVLVLDEPTAVLTPQEAEGLFKVLRRLAAAGLGVIFISHKLGEVLALADRVAVLRGGQKVAERPVAGADRAMLAGLMVGRAVAQSRREPRDPGRPLLELKGASARGTQGTGLVEASLTVREGEIVGVAGVSGNGQGALAALVAGTAPPTAGRLLLNGAELRRTSPAARVAAGVARVPEDRHREGIVGSLSIAENLALETLDRSETRRFGFLRRGALRRRAQAVIAAYDVRCPGPDAPIRQLSGGNIQKLILARGLERNPALILANQPTRGLDVGATADVHRRLLEARRRGAGVLLISEDLDELFALSDRIAVIAGGRLSPPEPTDELTLERVGLLMAGQRAEAA